jgi:hypothetical protein
VTVVLAATLCAGCARTSIDSKTLGEASSRIDRIALIFHSAQNFTLKSSYGPSYGKDVGINKAYENQSLVTRAVRRQFPDVFQKHGIELEVYLDPSDKGRLDQDANKQRHVMHLKPVAARYSSGAYGSGTTLYMEAQLVELRPARTLWQGNISVVRPQFATIDDDWATAFAEKIYAELKESKIIGVVNPMAASLPQPAVKRESGNQSAEQLAKAGPAPVEKPVKSEPRSATPGAPVALEDVDAVPLLDERGRQGYRNWLTKSTPRAFVIGDGGRWNSSSGRSRNSAEPSDPSERALANCQKRGLKNCKLYAVDYRVVWESN